MEMIIDRDDDDASADTVGSFDIKCDDQQSSSSSFIAAIANSLRIGPSSSPLSPSSAQSSISPIAASSSHTDSTTDSPASASSPISLSVSVSITFVLAMFMVILVMTITTSNIDNRHQAALDKLLHNKIKHDAEIEGKLKIEIDYASHDPSYPASSYPLLSAPAFGTIVVGSSGFIGSRLLTTLRQSIPPHRSIGYDRVHPRRASPDIPTEILHSYASVVYLGGYTDRETCDHAPERVEEENIGDIVRLARRMRSDQTLIFASTASIAEGYGDQDMKEDDEKMTSRFDTYTASLYKRELVLQAISNEWTIGNKDGNDTSADDAIDSSNSALDEAIELDQLDSDNAPSSSPSSFSLSTPSVLSYTSSSLSSHQLSEALVTSSTLFPRSRPPRMLGLRLGMVVGLSPSQRLEDAHATSICDAFNTARIVVEHGESWTSVLWMEDALRAIVRVLDRLGANTVAAIVGRFEIYQLSSFATTNGAIATSVASRTGAIVVARDHPLEDDSIGFSVDASKFEHAFDFAFEGTQQIVIDNLIDDVPRLCMGRPPRLLPHSVAVAPAQVNSIPCLICGGTDMVSVVDLHLQPLARPIDFHSTAEQALACKRYPLKLVRCKKCLHSQLSDIVDRGFLAAQKQASKSSKELQEHYEWLAHLIVSESRYPLSNIMPLAAASTPVSTDSSSNSPSIDASSSRTAGMILEVGCGDGSALDHFSSRGWNTFGIESASALASLASAKGHQIEVGFWGIDRFPSLPRPAELDAILSLNSLASSADPVGFLRAAAQAMGVHTRLYLTNSACNIYESNQFDQINHEQVSYFTAHSLKKAAEMSGLEVVDYQIVPVNSRSCLVTMMKSKPTVDFIQQPSQSPTSSPGVPSKVTMLPPPYATMIQKLKHATDLAEVDKAKCSASASSSTPVLDATSPSFSSSPSFTLALSREVELGLTTDWFYLKYFTRALDTRLWIGNMLAKQSRDGHAIIGFGAQANAIVLLQSLLDVADRQWNIEYIIDDSPSLQHSFVPCTSIPVRPIEVLSSHPPNNPLTILLFDHLNFDKIWQNLIAALRPSGRKEVYLLVPWPAQALHRIEVVSGAMSLLEQNTFRSLSWPTIFPEDRRKVVLVSHLRNEKFLLPYWIRHHAPLFDEAVLIDYASTDSSLSLIRAWAPHTWRVVQSRNKVFSAPEVDAEVVDYESLYPGTWRIALNSPEFLVHPDLRGWCAEQDRLLSLVESQPGVLTNEALGVDEAYRFPTWVAAGGDELALDRFSSLVLQRSKVSLVIPSKRNLDLDSASGNIEYSRFIHRNSAHYSLGRHGLSTSWTWTSSGFMLKMMWAPWPQILDRKLNVKDLIPASDFARGWGYHHAYDVAKMESEHSLWLGVTFNLGDVPQREPVTRRIVTVRIDPNNPDMNETIVEDVTLPMELSTQLAIDNRQLDIASRIWREMKTRET